MSNYTKTTDFEAKDSLPSGDSGKIIRGSEFETEFDNIATAIASKSDANNPTFTGTVTIDGLTVNGNTVLGNAATDTVTVTADIASNLLPSADDTYNLGAVGAEWNDLHVDGVAYIDTINGFAATGDVNFGDNNKAQFGAGNDLQIYHDTANSLIENSGTGNLLIRGSSDVYIQPSGGGSSMARFTASGAASLYHNGAEKLATTSTGVDVTGSVVSDGLTVDGVATIGGATDNANYQQSSGTQYITSRNGSSNGSIRLRSNDGTTTKNLVNFGGNNDVSFYEDTGTTTKLFWDASAERLGVGTSNVSTTLEVADSTPVLRLTNTQNLGNGQWDQVSMGAVQFYTSDTTSPGARVGAEIEAFSEDGASGPEFELVFKTSSVSESATERMRIDSSGNVGIGTGSPRSGYKLDVQESANNGVNIQAGDGISDIVLSVGSASTPDKFVIQSGGNVGIGNSAPTTALDVTGTVTADGLTVDGNAAVAGTIGVTADSGTITTGKDSASSRTHWSMNNPNGEVAKWDSNGTDLLHYITDEYKVYTAGNKAFEIDGNGDISFYEDTGTTAKFLWSASDEKLTIDGNGTTVTNLSTAVSQSVLELNGNSTQGSDALYFGAMNANGDHYLQVSNGNGTAVNYDLLLNPYGGNVGIGTDSPTAFIHAEGTGVGTETYAKFSTGPAAGDQILSVKSSSARNHMALQVNAGGGAVDDLALNPDGGNVGIGTTSPSVSLEVDGTIKASGNGKLQIADATEGSTFEFNVGGGGALEIYDGSTERMSLDAVCNLLVGTTSTTPQTGDHGFVARAKGYTIASMDDARAMLLNRATSDGEILNFRKDGTTVGSIGSFSGVVSYIALDPRTSGVNGAGVMGGSLSQTEGVIQPTNGAGAKDDDAINLGASNNRFKDIYATNGTIQTSDRNEKQDIEELSDAEQRVAVACKGLLRKFRWKSAVEEKGDDARIHFGIIAQDLQDAFTAEGLDAGRYGMFINSTWTDEETGEERLRMGVRYSELLAFIISAI